MKNFEAISASLYPYDVDPFLKEKACIDEGIDTQADYTVTHYCPLKMDGVKN